MADSRATYSQRCDGRQPCSRCVKANTDHECKYKIVHVSPGPDQPRFVFWNESDSSPPKGLSTKRWAAGDATQDKSTQTLIVAIREPALEVGPSIPALVHSPGHNGLQSLSQSRAPDEKRHPSPVLLPPFSTLLSRISSRIPPEPHLTLLPFGGDVGK